MTLFKPVSSIAMMLSLTACTYHNVPEAEAQAGQGYTMSAEEMISARTAHAKSEIMQLVHDYGFARDQGDAEAYANVFAKDGKFHFQGAVYEGREAIADRVRAATASSNGVSAHVIGLSQINFTSDSSANGQHYGMVYAKTLEAPYTGAPETFTGSPIVGIYTDEYSYTSDEGWKIADRAFRPIFIPE